MAEASARVADACYWTASEDRAPHAALKSETSADVAIIGGGIVGVIAARLLADAGRKVALVDRHALACDFEAADSFVYATGDDGLKQLEAERDAAQRAGLAMDIVADAGLPYPIAGALRLVGQAQFQPAAFTAGLAATLPDSGCEVFENSAVTDWDEHGVHTAHGSVRAATTIMATHLPLGQVGQFYAYTSPHMHAIMAAPVPAERAPAGMYISVDEPKRSLRRHRGADGKTVLILTGPRFTHGDAAGERTAFAELEKFAAEHFGWSGGGWRWSNEDYTPRDGLPYVGWEGDANKSLLVATGFDAWGLSNGAAAARILTDLAEGRDSAFGGCFAASRHSAKGLGTLLGNAASVTAGLVKGHAASHADTPLPAKPGEAALVEIDGRTAGVFRDDGGTLHAVSAVCTHMGCLLGWNPVDRTWDCPCHGSRFAVGGEVRHGPAIEPLPRIELESR